MPIKLLQHADFQPQNTRVFVRPAQITPFVGRREELAKISERLADPTCRLLTLVGPGGIGKTRLAIEAAASFVDTYRNGVYFVPLQALTSSGWIIPAIAEALHFQFEAGGDPKAQLLDFMNDQVALLLLDNFEHLLDGIDLITEVLNHAPSIKLLVTSRERLNLHDEWVFDVGGLTFPAGEQSQGQDIETYSAVQLFVQNARRAQPGFLLWDEAKAVARICALLEGMPLAIELASSWSRALSCADILAQMQHGLDILDSPTRDLPARHRSMSAALDNSWKHLSPAEKDVFMCMSVFRGGFTFDAVLAITNASPQIVYTLIDQSWLRFDSQAGRYDIHELLRQYGQARLEESGLSDETHTAHCSYYMDFLGRCEPRLKGKDQKGGLQDIEDDLENVRVALDWAVYHGQPSETNISLYSLWFFYDTGSRFHECEQLFAEVVEVLRANPSETDDSLLLGQALMIHGSMCHNLDRRAEAITDLEEAMTIFRRHNAQRDLAFSLYRMGITLSYLENRLLEAQNCFESSLNLYRELSDGSGMVTTLGWLGVVYRLQVRLLEAESSTLEGLTLARKRGVPWDTANAAVFRGEVMKQVGDYHEARRLFQEANQLYEGLGIQWGIIKSIREMGQLSLLLGDYAEARRCMVHAFNVGTRVRLTGHNLYTLIDYARLLEAQGIIGRAVEIFSLLERQFADLNQEHQSVLENLNRLEVSLTPTQFSAAVARGQLLDLDTTLRTVMAELSQPQPDSQPITDPLTARELEVLRLIAAGLTNRQIAEQMFLTVGTVKWYVNDIYSKLGVNSRTQALVRARELNLLS